MPRGAPPRISERSRIYGFHAPNNHRHNEKCRYFVNMVINVTLDFNEKLLRRDVKIFVMNLIS